MLKVYNTLTRQKEEFHPIVDGEVKLFVCGPTVYDHSHMGHAKTYTQFDFIVKYLRFKGYKVTYLQNITDIDDKIIKRANDIGVSFSDVAKKFEALYKKDMEALGNDSVDQYARATDFIDMVIHQINVLLKKGYAYITEDGVYYEVSRFPSYGKLSGRVELQEHDAVSRIDHSDFKRGWNDFCLWKFKKENEPSWLAEFGEGRPGWHIEDTAITEAIYGPQYDVHGGAIDLICPHHECEIAQMEAASGKEPLVKYWLHTGFLNINQEKMAKSTGNFKTIRAVLELFEARVIRYFLLRSHYRATTNFDEDALVDAKNTLNRFNNFLFDTDENVDDGYNQRQVDECKKLVIDALDDDFNAPEALSHVFNLIRELNTSGVQKGRHVMALFKELDRIFGGIFFITPKNLKIEEETNQLLSLRDKFRQERNFAESDRIRDELLSRGIIILDSKEGTKWRYI